MAAAAPPAPKSKLDPSVAAAVREAAREVIDPALALLKALEKPAANAGLSPEEYIARATDGGRRPGAFSDGGNFMPLPRFDPHGRRIGQKSHTEGGRTWTVDFADFLKTFAEYSVPNLGGKTEARHKKLQDMGVGVLRDNGDIITKTALAESSGITGGYTVPPMFEETLLRMKAEGSIFETRAAKQPLTSRTLQLPSLDMTTAYGAGISPFLGGIQASWQSEASSINESEPQFRQTTLTAWQLSFYAVASNILLQDNAVGLDALLTQLFGMAISWYTDYAYFQGNGVGKPMGVLNAPATLTVSRQNATHFTFQDVGNMLKHLYHMESQSPGLVWCVHPSVVGDLFHMNDASGAQTTYTYGRVLFQPIDQGAQAAPDRPSGPQSFGRLAGIPVLVTEKLPNLGTTGDVMLIDCSKYLLGQRMEVEIQVSPHVKFLNYQMVWRVVWRGDGVPWLNNVITLADGTYTVSPFLALT